jgi:hypothetical protein
MVLLRSVLISTVLLLAFGPDEQMRLVSPPASSHTGIEFGDRICLRSTQLQVNGYFLIYA